MFFYYLFLYLSISLASNDFEHLFSYYERIPKSSLHLPTRIKRSSNYHHTLNIHFKQKNYQLVLSERVSDVTSENLMIHEINGQGVKKQIFPQYNLFHGSVIGENNSRVAVMFASDGKLDMITMQTMNDDLLVESMSKYRKNKNSESKRSDEEEDEYIVYSSKDVKTFNSKHPCSSTDSSNIRRNLFHQEKISSQHTTPSNNRHNHNVVETNDEYASEWVSYTQKRKSKADNVNNIKNNDKYFKENQNRSKRKRKRSAALCSSADHKVCELMMVVDYDFYKDIGDEDSASTTRLVISLVDMVNSIFRDVTFGECGKGFVFRISRMDIHTAYSKKFKHFNHNSPNISPRTLLQNFGYYSELKQHCLGHLLTAKAFRNDTLGLSNVANPDMKYKYRVSRGGVCSNQCNTATLLNQKTFANTGLTTFKNSYVDKIPSLQAALVFAHELAHSMGSEHDHSLSCSPKHYPGKFLMYKYAVSGFEPNNKKLSSCSRKKITQVLRKKAQYCFKASRKNYCGNHKVEEGEECDEGMVKGDSEFHHCCHLATCRLKTTSQCSDLNHECCHACQYASNTTMCGAKDICHSNAFCSGSSTVCGKARAINNAHKCQTGNGESGVCDGGQCVNLCHIKNLDTCLCKGKDSCKVCCKKRSVLGSGGHSGESGYGDEEYASGDNEDERDEDEEERDDEDEEENDEVDGGEEVCSPIKPFTMLSTGTACSNGFCSEGVCKKTKGGILNRLWEIMRINDISQFRIFVKNNIVGIIIFFSSLIWAPAMCIINRYDKHMKEMELKECQNYSIHSNELVSGNDNVLIKKSNSVKRKNSVLGRRMAK